MKKNIFLTIALLTCTALNAQAPDPTDWNKGKKNPNQPVLLVNHDTWWSPEITESAVKEN